MTTTTTMTVNGEKKVIGFGSPSLPASRLYQNEFASASNVVVVGDDDNSSRVSILRARATKARIFVAATICSYQSYRAHSFRFDKRQQFLCRDDGGGGGGDDGGGGRRWRFVCVCVIKMRENTYEDTRYGNSTISDVWWWSSSRLPLAFLAHFLHSVTKLRKIER